VGGFEWYLIFLEGPFSDEIREQIDTHFATLGKEVGREVLVVRGNDPTEFRESVEAAAFYKQEWHERVDPPALIVMNEAPKALEESEKLDNAKVMIFSLREMFERHGSIVDFLTALLKAIKSKDSIEALESLEPKKLEKQWGWLSKYVEIKPRFLGFKFNADSAITDLVSNK
jgi:Xaa-Pro aminopeptidase